MIFKKMNLFIVLVMLVGSVFVVMIDNVNMGRFFTYLGLIVAIGLPFLFYKTRFMFGDKQLFLYYVFVFLADYLGCICNFYDYIWWYDIFVHFLAGIFIYIFGMFILEKFGLVHNFLFDIFFCLMFVMAVSGFWEIFEYLIDRFLFLDMQNAIETGVKDTMEDMIAAFLGSIIYFEYVVLKTKEI